MYQRLVSIRPFPDANGRTARFVMDWILESMATRPRRFKASSSWEPSPTSEIRDNPAPGLAEERVTNGVLWSVDHMKSAMRISPNVRDKDNPVPAEMETDHLRQNKKTSEIGPADVGYNYHR